MTSAELEAMKAAFAAKGGSVTQVAAGEGLNLTGRDWYVAARAPQSERYSAEQASEQYMERVREAAHVGGRSAAIEAMQGRR